MFVNVLTQVVILFILMLLGVILAKAKILTQNGVKSMTDMVLYLVTPCVIIKSFAREFQPELLKKLLLSFLMAILSHLIFIALCKLFLHSKEPTSERVLKFGAIFSNCGYMSIPLQQALLGEDGVFYGASYIAIFNIFVWTYGLWLMSGDKKSVSPKKLIINPGIIGVAVGMIIFLLSVPLPQILFEPVSYLASLNTPLPMIIIGFHLAHSNPLSGLKNIRCVFAIALKLILFPLLMLGAAYLCGIKDSLLVSLVISCSAPTAAVTTMFSAKYGGDTSLSVNMVSLSTVFSLFTMPLIITLAQFSA